MFVDVVEFSKKKINDIKVLLDKRAKLQDLVLYSGAKMDDAKQEFYKAYADIEQKYPDSNELWRTIKAMDVVEDKYLSDILPDYTHHR